VEICANKYTVIYSGDVKIVIDNPCEEIDYCGDNMLDHDVVPPFFLRIVC
jgi:hypothetical protein